MKVTLLVLILLTVVTGASSAQQRAGRASSTQWGAVDTYNASGTMRVSGTFEVPREREVTGDVAVLNGPVIVAGRITGTLVAINADVRLIAGAQIGEHLIIVGGTLSREDSVTISGEVRTQAELLRYSLDDERLVPEEDRGADWRPHFDRPDRDHGDSYTELFFVAARTYNRVEGLPVLVGPRFRRPTNWGRIQVEAFGVVRTAEPIRWNRGTLGHEAQADLRLGVRRGLVVSGRAFDIMEPVEPWALSDQEAGLSAFFLHRDMRDYYGRHGWEAALGGRIGEELSLNLVAGSEQWRSVGLRAPFTLFRNQDPWRPNPGADVGRVDLASVRLRVDTRERVRSTFWGGWYVSADLERGSGTIARDPGPLPVIPVPEPVTYTRGFVDARRYNRLSPGTEVNFRIVTGGWLGGDQLPTQRRLSVGGPGSIEGYDFRRNWNEPLDAFTCGGIATSAGRPALCDRIALAQIELRQSLDLSWYPLDDGDHWWRPGGDMTPVWVIFADAGRGWNTPGGAPGIGYGTGLPPLSTFRTSIGGGIDFGSLGVYMSKSLSTAREPVNFLVRLGRRF